MSNQSGSSVISKPSGGGAMQGLGEKFSPDLFTGTGNFSVPIAVPPGRNGLQPQLSLQYSTGNGNSPFGLGWGLSVPNVSRKTSKGIPNYDDDLDTFILSGAEDLVPVEKGIGFTRYQPRTEGIFARIFHFKDSLNDYWKVMTTDGLTSLYGTPNTKGNDPATVFDPNDKSKIFSWHLTKTLDSFGSCISYFYFSDLQSIGSREWNQLYLSEIKYADYGDPAQPQFLVSIKFNYQSRSDAFSVFRQGFEIRTTKRCDSIETFTHDTPNTLIRRYDIIYVDEKVVTGELPVAAQPMNGASLLSEVRVTGFKGGQSETMPPLTMGYTVFQPDQHDLMRITGKDLPQFSLATPGYELADLSGNGLPDIVEMTGGIIRYWRNLGNGVFDMPRQMSEAPAGLFLSSPDVQFIDANGDARIDLMVNTPGVSGYYSTEFGGTWSRKSFKKYDKAPSFSLQDPEVKMVDLNGDGITDAIRNGSRFECFFHDPEQGWNKTRFVSKQQIQDFPNISFADPRIRWADMSGDGMQDIVLIQNGHIEYWANLGHGNFSTRISMRQSPRFPYRYLPQNILLGDVDGDGVADIIYVENNQITLWLNKSGNEWSEPLVITGTPAVNSSVDVRLEDMFGRGVAGVLWSMNNGGSQRHHLYYLDLTKGIKPYILNETDNHMGALTRVAYRSSIEDFLRDEKTPANRWKTTLPFPVQTVAKVEVIDQLSQGKMVTEYSYHHGYWDGGEREFRGFGRVDQRDTESFDRYHSEDLHGSTPFQSVDTVYYTPPLETRTWFHLGAVGDGHGDWQAVEFTDEYWQGDVNVFPPLDDLNSLLKGLPRRAKRDAFRALRGNMLRTELYALDGSTLQNLPYTVTEGQFSVKHIFTLPGEETTGRNFIFFPHGVAQRTTQWERGNDPMTQLSFTADFDEFGQAQSSIGIAVPRKRRYWELDNNAAEPYFATFSATTYCMPVVTDNLYRVDRAARATTYEIPNNGKQNAFDLAKAILAAAVTYKPIGQTFTFYDGPAFEGLPFRQTGDYGLPVRTETLWLTPEIAQSAYGSVLPPYLDPLSNTPWSGDYPPDFQNNMPTLAGFKYHNSSQEADFVTGWFAQGASSKYDFQDTGNQNPRGLSLATRDPFGNETSIHYDSYLLLPEKVTDPQGMTVQAEYDYSTLQVQRMTDPNGNQSEFAFSPLGLLQAAAVMGKPGENKGDTLQTPGIRYEYDFFAFVNYQQPVWVKTITREQHVKDNLGDSTIEKIDFSDGFGRLLQTRVQADDVVFGNSLFGDSGLPANPSAANVPAVGVENTVGAPPQVVVSGWQTYNNKGWVVEKFEPYFDKDWDYLPPSEDADNGRRVRMFYDPRGNAIRTLNPDGTEQRVIYGILEPQNLNTPANFQPSPWETYTYDANDLAPFTHPNDTSVPATHHYTPNSNLLDALGRTIRTTNHKAQLLSVGAEHVVMLYHYDIRGNLVEVKDPYTRTAFFHVFDLKPKSGEDDPGANILRTQHLDGGVKTSVFNAVGNPLEAGDSKGSRIFNAYDKLNRPTRQWARDNASEPVTLRQVTLYGDSAGLTNPQAANLLGKPWKAYDEAGMVENPAFDFKGNPLKTTRRVIADAAILTAFQGSQIQTFRIDWSGNITIREAALLDSTSFETDMEYDGLNRVTRMTYPKDVTGERKTLRPSYNRAGALRSVALEAPGSSQSLVSVEHIAYSAKGQRLLVAYGNGMMTRYAYDPLTFRLQRLRSEKYARSRWTFTPQSGSTKQDACYTYDLAGNITGIQDKSPNSGVAGIGDLQRTFNYDPLYRLLSATGRETETAAPVPPWLDTPATADPNLTRGYTQHYDYDKLGNIQTLKHTTPLGMGNFTRKFNYQFGKNLLDEVQVGNGSSQTYGFTWDANGNQVQEDASRFFEWDWADRMRAFYVSASGSVSQHAHYLYDAGGNRVKKLVRKQGGDLLVTVYIGGMMDYQYTNQGSNITENNTLHLMDDRVRVATLRIGTPFPDDTTPSVKYNLEDHLGNASFSLDGNGGLVSQEEYYPFGETSFGSYGKKRYRFVGKEKDEESGLYYYGARYYSAWVCRFVSVDPLFRDYAYCTPYQYAGNKPINFIDLDGKEIALPEQKEKAINLIEDFENNFDSKQAFKNISKEKIISDLKNIIDCPSDLKIPYGSRYFCGLYALSYVNAYYSPENFVKSVLDLYQFGETNMKSQKVKASDSLKEAIPEDYHEVSAFILGLSMRETGNITSYGVGNKWNTWYSTNSTTMENWLSNNLGLQIEKFIYGYEFTADGITLDDMKTLSTHIDSGNSAVLLVDGDEFADGSGDGRGAFYGDHYIVIQNKLVINGEKINFQVYDDHQGLVDREMPLSTFMDMTNIVLMIKK